MRIIKLKFKSPLHVGNIGIGLEECTPVVHSDTIFNAIISAYSLMHTKEETNNFLKTFCNVRISSAFPYKEDTIYFPKPRIRINTNIDDFKILKDLKKVEFIPKEYFDKIINMEELDHKDLKSLTTNTGGFYKEEQIPKVYLDRERYTSDFFFIGTIRFYSDSGLWFSIDCDDTVYDDIIPCLRLLQDEGIGGKRTWGCGLFDYEETEMKLRLPINHEAYLLLSLLYPNTNDITLFNGTYASWDFIIRGGYFRKARKPRIWMVKEGSIFDEMPKGKILKFDGFMDYGIAYSIPVSIKEA